MSASTWGDRVRRVPPARLAARPVSGWQSDPAPSSRRTSARRREESSRCRSRCFLHWANASARSGRCQARGIRGGFGVRPVVLVSARRRHDPDARRAPRRCDAVPDDNRVPPSVGRQEILIADFQARGSSPIRVSGAQPFLAKRPRGPRGVTRRSCPATAARRRWFRRLAIGVAPRAYSRRTSGGKCQA